MLPIIGVTQRFSLFSALPDVSAVIAAVDLQPLVFNLPDCLGEVVDKVTVVAYSQDGAGVSCQIFLQPLDRLNIQMICRLIEYQQVRFFQEQAAKQGPSLLPAGQFGQRHFIFVRAKAQPRQHHLDARFVAISTQALKLGLQRTVTFQRLLIVVGIGHLLLQLRELRLRLTQVGKGFELLLPEAMVARKFRALRQKGDPYIASYAHRSMCRKINAGQ